MYASPRPPGAARRRAATALIACLAAALATATLAGCGSTSDGQTSADASASQSSSAGASPSTTSAVKQRVDVRVEGDEVTPRDERIEVEAGEPLLLRVVSDRKGELHVHDSAGTTFDFGPGTSTLVTTIERPGIVELEEHVSDTLVAQLEAR